MVLTRPYDAVFESMYGLGEVDRRSKEYIRWVQQSLNQLQNAGLAVDGIAGPLTRNAVRAFQGRAGLVQDGVVGPLTEAALVRAGAPPPPGSGGGTSPTPPGPTPAPGDPVAQNAEQGRRLGWDTLQPAIAAWILQLPDGASPQAFANAVGRWQTGHGMSNTGVIDLTTWQAMLREAKAGIPTPFRTPDGVNRPHGLSAIVSTFGDPTRSGWESANLVRVTAPGGQSFGSSTTLRVHRLIAPQWDRLFQAIYAEGLWNEIVPSAGTFVCRTKKQYGKKPCGTPGIAFDQLSTHSWGITIDIRADDYPFVEGPGVAARYPPPAVVRAFQRHGFHAGLWFMKGTLDSRGRIDMTGADGMHFQYATGF